MPRGRKKGDMDKPKPGEGGLVAMVDIEEELEDGQKVRHGIDISKFGLTQKELEFVLEYMDNGMNGPNAARKVYGSTQGASYGKANTVINSGKVFPVIQLLIKHSINKQLQFSPALLMSNIQTWLQYDIRNYYTSDGSAIELDDISEDARQLISGVDYTVNNRTGERLVTYKLPDKYKALQELSSIVKFLQSIQSASPEDDSEAALKRDQIFKKVTNYRPVNAEVAKEE